jgi:hypothetical protein
MGKTIHWGSPLIAFAVMSSIALAQEGFVTLSACSYGECSGQQASCGGGGRGPSAE